jgi:ATP-dependent helicase/nuclease subunit A
MIPIKPAGVMWTDAQWKAIHLKGKNILVSAGAGSGKTAVLTERVFNLVKNGIDINQLLIVTFTKAAALEMKERIRKRIIDAVAEGDESLYPQLALLEIAHISTFDSFSYQVVKKYGHLKGLSSDITIGDKVLMDQLKAKVLDELIELKHQEKDPEFIQFVKRYSLKEGRLIRSMISDLAESLMKRPDFQTLLDEDLSFYQSSSFFEKIQTDLETEIKDAIHQLWVFLNTLNEVVESLDHQGYVETVTKQCEGLFTLSSYEEVRHFVFDFTLKPIPRNYLSEEEVSSKEIFKKIHEMIKKIITHLKTLTEQPLADHFAILKDNHPYQITLKNLTKTYIERLMERQIEHKIFDFQSMAYLSIDLLRTLPEALNEMQGMFKEILVDEYQDTSPLQDALMTMISSHNLYTVGDIKQSIYRFRDANPKLFQAKYKTYLEKGTGEVIHLNENFRSRKEVIDHINHLFDKVFDEEVGGVDYQKDQALKFGFTPYLEASTQQDYGMTFIKYDKKDFDDHFENSEEGFSKKQSSALAEAQMMVKDIIQKIDQGYQVFDKKTGVLRPAKYHDFVILIDRKSHFKRLLEVFQSYQVPLHVHQQDTFISNTDVLVIVNLLKLLLSLSDEAFTKTYFKHAFLSVAYSYITEATHDDIIEFMLRVELNPEAIFKASKGTPFEGLFSLLKDLIEAQDYLKLSDILHRFNQDLDLLRKGLSLYDIASIEERLIYILDQVKAFEHQDFTLKELVDYYHYAVLHHNPMNFFSSVDIDYVRGTAVVEDKVNVMTIHKSKGLEFPVVYYPQLTLPWPSISSSTRYSNQYGILMPAYDQGLLKPITQLLDDAFEEKEALSERMRLFYVALTRSKEAIILIYQHNADDLPSSMFIDDKNQVYPGFKRQFNDYQSIIHAVFETYLESAKIVELNEEDYTERLGQAPVKTFT